MEGVPSKAGGTGGQSKPSRWLRVLAAGRQLHPGTTGLSPCVPWPRSGAGSGGSVAISSGNLVLATRSS